jgi:hypothetical protein
MSFTCLMALALLLLGSSVMPGQDALAQTRLGLFFTKEEIEIWKQRAQSGPYRSAGDAQAHSPGDWDRIKANAEAFVANPSAQRWTGNTAGRCINQNDHYPTTPNATMGNQIRDAAFAYLITGNAAYKKAVRNELITMAGLPGTQWQGTVWRGVNDSCLDDLPNGYDPALQIVGTWGRKLVLAYDFIRFELSISDRTTLDRWFINFGMRFEIPIYKRVLETIWPNRSVDDYRSSPYAAQYAYILYYNGPQWGWWHSGWANWMTAGMGTISLIGLVTDDPYLKNQGKRYFKELVRYGMWPEGAVGDLYRWDADGYNGASPCSKGWAYAGAQLGDMALMAEGYARAGDKSLYNYTTTEGYNGTSNGSSVKGLKMAILYYQGLVNGSIVKPGTRDARKVADARYRIDSRCDDFASTGETGAMNWRGIHDIWSGAVANRYYRDSMITQGYRRQQSGAPAYPSDPNGIYNGGASVWEGSQATLPGVLFMFGQMEDKVNPYPSQQELPAP